MFEERTEQNLSRSRQTTWSSLVVSSWETLVEGACISASSESSLGAIPQLIPQPYKTERGTGPDSPILASMAMMLILLFLAGSLSNWTSQKPLVLLSLELRRTLASVSGLDVLEVLLGREMLDLSLPVFLWPALALDGPGWNSALWNSTVPALVFCRSASSDRVATDPSRWLAFLFCEAITP